MSASAPTAARTPLCWLLAITVAAWGRATHADVPRDPPMPVPPEAGSPLPRPIGEDPEPNDSYNEAVALVLPPPGVTRAVPGVIGNQLAPNDPTDVDRYRFEVPAALPLPLLLRIFVDGGETLDSRLRLYTADFLGNELVWVASGDDENWPADPDAGIRTYLFAAGSYGFAVSGGSEPGLGEGDYVLWIGVRSVTPPASLLEPNDSLATATDIGAGPYQIAGEFIGDGPTPQTDVDVYKLTLTGPAIVTADVVGLVREVTLDPAMSLVTASGVIAVNDDAALDTHDARITAAAFSAGAYYIKVYGAGREDAVGSLGAQRGSFGYYDLTIDLTPITDPGGPNEPNDSLLEAPTVLAYSGQATLSGVVGDGRFASTRGDVDLYHVAAWHGSIVSVDVDAATIGSPLDPVVVVFDYFGSVLARNDNDGATTDSLATFAARQPGPTDPADFYVMVMGTAQARPRDPLVPNPDASDVRPSEHTVVESTSSAGAYDLTIDIVCGSGCNNCCLTRAEPGCSVPEIETCVCEVRPSCCTSDWDEQCVQAVVDAGCGQCPPDIPMQSGQSWTQTATTLAVDPPPSRVFATTLDDPPDSIVELDPATGAVVARHSVPEHIVRVGQGLALQDDTLFYLGHGRFPRLYWLDPKTGDVLDWTILWSGSGYYGDLAMLGGHLFVTDLLDQSVHEIDPTIVTALRTIDVGTLNDIRLTGALASLSCPDRLYLADAVDTGAIYAIDPATGLVDESLSPGLPCPCNADFDADGDVDADDQAFFTDQCVTANHTVQFFCRQADLDCDDDIDADDLAILTCQNAGPGHPPSDDCCPAGLPDVPVWADALGGSGLDALYVSDWLSQSIEVYESGVLQQSIPMGTQIGAITGEPAAVCPPVAPSNQRKSGHQNPTKRRGSGHQDPTEHQP